MSPDTGSCRIQNCYTFNRPLKLEQPPYTPILLIYTRKFFSLFMLGLLTSTVALIIENIMIVREKKKQIHPESNEIRVDQSQVASTADSSLDRKNRQPERMSDCGPLCESNFMNGSISSSNVNVLHTVASRTSVEFNPFRYRNDQRAFVLRYMEEKKNRVAPRVPQRVLDSRGNQRRSLDLAVCRRNRVAPGSSIP